MTRMFVGLLLLLALTTAHAAAPRSVHLSYDVFKFGVKGATMNETFTRTDNHYKIEGVAEAYGIVALVKPETIRTTSEGTVTEHGLRPDTFIITRKLDSHLNVRADFDWAHMQITLTDQKGKRTLPLKAGTQDRASAMYQFMFLPVETMKELTFDMTNGSKLDIYHYILTPGQRLTIPLGTFKTTYVTNPPEPNVTRTEVWLATERANVVCKMVLTDPDGSKFSQVATKIEIEP